MFAAPMPKRWLTTFTSSGCETNLGTGSAPFCPGATAIAVENAGDMVRSEVVVEIVVDLNGGRPAARSDALDLFEGEQSVRRHALVANAQFFLKSLVEVVSPAQHAADVRAYLHVVSSRRLESQHRVIAGHISYIELSNADALRHFGDHGVGEIANLVLRIEQHGHQR